jgi:hypothetical protein
MRRLTILLSALNALGLACGHAEDFSAVRPDPSPLVGGACTGDAECDQHCIRDDDFPGGFCTLLGCRSNEDCPDGTVCVTAEGGVCLFPCEGPLDCTATFLGRSGYTCRTAAGFSREGVSRVSYQVCIGS